MMSKQRPRVGDVNPIADLDGGWTLFERVLGVRKSKDYWGRVRWLKTTTTFRRKR